MTQKRTAVKRQAALANVALASTCMERLMNAPTHLPRMGVFYGPAGFGKTQSTIYLMNRHNAYRIECKSLWNRKWFLQELLRRMGLVPGRTMPEMLDQACAQLMLSGRPLIIDEMDHLVEKSAVEIVRDIYDGSQAPILLVGEEQLPHKLKRWERVHSRVLDWTPAQPLSLDDAETLAAFYCHRVRVAPDLVAYIHSKSGGSARRIVVNLELAQEEALRAGRSEIDLAAWGNRPLYTGEAPVRSRR